MNLPQEQTPLTPDEREHLLARLQGHVHTPHLDKLTDEGLALAVSLLPDGESAEPAEQSEPAAETPPDPGPDDERSEPAGPPDHSGEPSPATERPTPKARETDTGPAKETFRSPAFQFYPADWLSSKDIALMTPAEEGAYIRLLALSWLDPTCSIPDDDSQLVKLSRLFNRWSRSAKKIRAKFRSEGGRLFNDRLLEEREKQEAYRLERSKAGRAGNAKRWRSDRSAIPLRSLSDKKTIANDRSSSSSSSSRTTPPTPSSDFDPAPGWERFRVEYPGQVIPDRDCQVWLSVIASSADEGLLFSNLPAWRECRQAREGFMPGGQRFLFEGWWKTRPKDAALADPGDVPEYRHAWEDDHAAK